MKCEILWLHYVRLMVIAVCGYPHGIDFVAIKVMVTPMATVYRSAAVPTSRRRIGASVLWVKDGSIYD